MSGQRCRRIEGQAVQAAAPGKWQKGPENRRSMEAQAGKTRDTTGRAAWVRASFRAAPRHIHGNENRARRLSGSVQYPQWPVRSFRQAKHIVGPEAIERSRGASARDLLDGSFL